MALQKLYQPCSRGRPNELSLEKALVGMIAHLTDLLRGFRLGLQPRSYVIGMRPWRKLVRYWLLEDKVVLKGRMISKVHFFLLVAPSIVARPGSKIFIWGYKAPSFIETFCSKWSVPLVRVEDGFIRSVHFGATRAPPVSLCFDTSAMYFDATQQSDLERIIETYNFDADKDLMRRARDGLAKLVDSRLSKYNASADADTETLYGPKDRKRILVVGQVESDASIERGCDRKIDNVGLVRIAVQENPDAQVIYKPHPEVLRGIRINKSDPADLGNICMVLDQDIALADAFRTIDHVYTITSLSGFEALIRGIKVTCIGMPFYAGWGVSDDRQLCPRREARRTVEEIFAASYILYPKYFNPVTNSSMTFEEALDFVAAMKSENTGTSASTRVQAY